MRKNKIDRLPTGVPGLDRLLEGGLPLTSVTVIGGTPGAGKTTLAQQICFMNCSPENKALIFQTLSEPAAKTMKYMGQFEFFDAKKINNGIEIVDLGGVLRAKGLESAIKTLNDHIKRVQPKIVVIDSFKVFEDLAANKEELRKFTYEVAVQLMAWEITGLLLGEYGLDAIQNNSLSSIIDGIIAMSELEIGGKFKRGIRVMKMRGTRHSREYHLYEITERGITLSRPLKKNAKTKRK
jgi:circadian clock protein KaiC